MKPCPRSDAYWQETRNGRVHMVKNDQTSPLRWMTRTCSTCGGHGVVEPEPEEVWGYVSEDPLDGKCCAWFGGGLICLLEEDHTVAQPHEVIIEHLKPGQSSTATARENCLLVFDHAAGTVSYVEAPGQTGVVVRGPVDAAGENVNEVAMPGVQTLAVNVYGGSGSSAGGVVIGAGGL